MSKNYILAYILILAQRRFCFTCFHFFVFSERRWAHYNRHRYKMPPEILITDELSSMTEDLLEDN